VTFLGFVSQEHLREYLRLADLYISVSESDSSATSMLEAMACGATIVAADIPANREWIRHAQNGWLVDPTEIEGFTATCLGALRQPLNPEALRANRRRIETEADFETNMQAIESFFIQMASNASRMRAGSSIGRNASRNRPGASDGPGGEGVASSCRAINPPVTRAAGANESG
jgi:glycosyltransferase involved in cell wall biosynthesis